MAKNPNGNGNGGSGSKNTDEKAETPALPPYKGPKADGNKVFNVKHPHAGERPIRANSGPEAEKEFSRIMGISSTVHPYSVSDAPDYDQRCANDPPEPKPEPKKVKPE